MRIAVVALTLCLLAPAAVALTEEGQAQGQARRLAEGPARGSPGDTVVRALSAMAAAADVPATTIDARPCGSLADELERSARYLGVAVPATPRLAPRESTAIAELVCALHDASLARDAAYAGVDWRILAEDVLSGTEAPRVELTPAHVAVNAAGAAHVAHAVDRALAALGPRTALVGATPGLAPPEFALAPVLAFDTIGLDTLYDTDYALVVDVGGNDVYANNAGGSFIAFGDGGFLPILGDPSSFGPELEPVTGGPRVVFGGDFEDAELIFSASLVLDLAGDDRYGVKQAPWGDARCTAEPVVRKVAIQGTGAGGPGMLFDLAGTNTFTAKTVAQGAGHVGGVGVLYLGPGNDRLEAVRLAQGSGLFFGLGLLINEGGDDEYLARVPEGGVFNTDGSFCDDEPRYLHGTGFARVTGGASGVAGALIDLAGDDRYEAGGSKNLGFAEVASVGIFLDVAGADTYSARTKSLGYASGHPSTSGGGAALFYDAAGDDTYTLTEGAGLAGTPGRLAGPEDLPMPYTPATFWVNQVVSTFVDPVLISGGAVFLDAAGSDAYFTPDPRANGEAKATNVGAVFVDLA